MRSAKRFKKALATIISILLIILASVGMTGCSKSDNNIKLGTAGIGGNYYSFGQAYAGMINSDESGITLTVKETAGSSANLRLLSDKYIQMAIAQSDVIASADDQGLGGYSAIGALYTESCQIVVPSDSNIQSVKDLKGKVVNIGEEESGTEQNALQILQAYGLQESNITVSSLNYNDAADSMLNGEIDAMFVTVGVKTPVIDSLSQKMGIRLISLDDTAISLLQDSYSFYTKSVIPAGTYKGQNDDVTTVGVRAILLASDELSKETVIELTSALFEHSTDLTNAISIDFELTPETAIEGVPIGFHNGAVEFYESIGIEVSNVGSSKANG